MAGYSELMFYARCVGGPIDGQKVGVSENVTHEACAFDLGDDDEWWGRYVLERRDGVWRWEEGRGGTK